jgi:hypothetical protein
MSATLEVGTFTSYFPDAGQIQVTGRTFPVDRYYLGTALRAVGFSPKGGPKAHTVQAPDKDPPVGLEAASSGLTHRQLEALMHRTWHATATVVAKSLDEMFATADEMAETMEEVAGGVTVNHQHHVTGLTLLMLAAAKGCESQCTRLLAMGAAPEARASNGWRASEFAAHFRRPAVVALLASSDPDADLCAQYVNLNSARKLPCP